MGSPADAGVTDSGSVDSGTPTDAGTSTDAGFDTSAAGLKAFAASGQYKSWKSDAVHDSTGPHGGKVKVFVNDTLFASLKAGNAVHPPGSIAVKELLGSSGTAMNGHAIDVKDTDGTWVFWEGFPTGSPFYFRGTSNFCASCHQPGKDYYLGIIANLQ